MMNNRYVRTPPNHHHHHYHRRRLLNVHASEPIPPEQGQPAPPELLKRHGTKANSFISTEKMQLQFNKVGVEYPPVVIDGACDAAFLSTVDDLQHSI